MTNDDTHHRVLVIGGGNGGISVAARLRNAGVDDIAIIEPREVHEYKPLFSHVAGGTARGIRGPASLVVLVAAASGGALVFALAGPIVLALGGGELPGAVAVLRVLCLLPFLTGLTAILGANTLLAEGRGDVYAASQIAVALLGLPLAALAIMQGGAVGAAWAAVVTEAGLALGYGLALRRAGLMARVLR